MKIALCTIGSTGDIQPFLALAQVLVKRKHFVRVCTNAFYRERFEAVGAEFAAIGADATWDRVRGPLQRIITSQNLMTQFSILAQEMFQNPAQAYSQYQEALQGVDVAAMHFLDPMAAVAAEHARIPWAQVRFESGGIASRHQMALHMGTLGPWLNRASWAVGDIYWRRQEQKLFGAWMRHHPRHPRPLLMRGYSPHLNLLAAAKSLAPVYPDLPATFAQTGAWFFEEPAFAPPDEVLDFFARHPRPLLATFGSMGAEDGQSVAALLLAAARQAGTPLVLQKGFSQFALPPAPDLLVVGYAPHGWLFPKVAAVVHHGGAGTSTAACRAGVPSIVVPHLLDQFGWARVLHRKGLCPKPIPRRKLRVDRLARTIREALKEPGYHSRSRAVAQQIATEPGTAQAADLLEGLAKRS
jgi:sterol 3beta-glucosyltransferase